MKLPELGYKWLPMKYKDAVQIQSVIQHYDAETDYNPAKSKDIIIKADKYVRQQLRYVSQPNEVNFLNPPYAGVGDCDDFALAWYRELRRMGIPHEFLYIVVGQLEPKLYHAICIAKQHQSSWWCFDCRHPYAFPMRFYPFNPVFAVNTFDSFIAGIPK